MKMAKISGDNETRPTQDVESGSNHDMCYGSVF